jgi:endoglucanase
MLRRGIIISMVLVILVIAIIGGVLLGLRLVQGGSATTATTPTAISTSTSATFTTTGILHVEGTQLIDATGHPIILRGAQIESPFNYIKRWERGEQPSASLNSTIFNAMVHDWKMNVLRLPTSNWIYAKYPVDYLNKLDQVVQQANAAGLYVVLDLHDTVQGGSPYSKDATLPKTEDIAYWKTIAAHYKNNPMVLFDLYNEPKYHDWNTWLHGGGTVAGATVVGMQDLVDAIRSVGARQIVIVAPGSAGKGVPGLDAAEEGGWATVGTHLINDPNVMYTLHVYDKISFTAQQQDTQWGPILNHYPLYYGEWAFLPNAAIPAHCMGVPHDQADQVVKDFLDYMASRHASWSAWDFSPPQLIQDYTTFTPTSLDIPWTYGDPKSAAGMGAIVKQSLTGQ